VETLERIAKQEGMSVSALHRRLRKLRAALAAHLRKEGIEP
jgi:DNA-directed RNA polymerase specialized sigma24 family protein